MIWAVLAVAVLTTASATGQPTEEPAFRLEDSRITESSALVVSRTHPHLAYTVDDSGDRARVFGVDTRTGETVGVTRLAGVDGEDFEALAFAPGGWLLIGDIGDNAAERDSVQVHVIPEPDPGDSAVRPHTITLTYADGAQDAEAVLVRDRTLFVVSKQPVRGAVSRGPSLGRSLAEPLPEVATLRPVAGAPGLVTDATVLGDGRVVLRNYTAAFVMTPRWEIAQTITLPASEQGESIAAPPHGDWFYVGTEGEDSPVFRVSLPPRSIATVSPKASVTAPSAPPDSVDGTDLPGWLWWVGPVVLALGAAAVALAGRRR